MRRGRHADIHIVLRYQHATMNRDHELADRMSDRAAAAIERTRDEGEETSLGRLGHL